MVDLLSNDSRIQYAEPNIVFHPTADPNPLVDWIETGVLLPNSIEYESTRPVAALQLPGGNWCTGFLVAVDVLMTAHHCVPSQLAAQEVKAVFGWETGVPKEQWETYSCDILLETWAESSWGATLLRCRAGPLNASEQTLPGERWGTASLCNEKIKSDNPIYVVHQNDRLTSDTFGQNKKIAFGVVANPNWDKYLLSHDADTLNGSSGGPLFNPETSNVIAYHRGATTGDVVINLATSIEAFHPELERSGWWSALSHCDS